MGSFVHILAYLVVHPSIHSFIPEIIHSFKTNSRQEMDQDTEVLTILLVFSFIYVKLGCWLQGEVILLGDQCQGPRSSPHVALFARTLPQLT